MSLHAALVDMRQTLASELLPEGTFLTPQCIMRDQLLQRIVDLAHDQKITTVTHLHEQITWGHLDTHAEAIICLIKTFCPPPNTASPFTTAPLQPSAQRLSAATPASEAPKKQRNCKKCGVPGHYGMYCGLFTIIMI